VPSEPGKRPTGPQIAAAAAASSTAHALELDVAEAPERRTIDKSATLQRIIRNIPRHAPSRQAPAPSGDTIMPETADHAARRAALEEAARVAAEMEEQARNAAEEEERQRQEQLERAIREAEERARQEAEERARFEAEEKARLEALEQARVEAERKAIEAEERARAAEEAARIAEEHARIAEEERKRRAAEDQARYEAEERARTEEIEQAKAEAAERARVEAEERARAEAEEKARLEAAREAMKEAEARQREAERLQREAEAEAAAAQEAAEKEAKRLEKEAARAAKEAQKQSKRDQKKVAEAAREAAQKSEEHRQQEIAAVETQTAPKPQRKTRLDRRYDRQVAALGLVEDETVTIMADGRSGVRRATMFVTRFRVAIVSRSRRKPSVHWIPLEEVTTVETAWRGAPTIVVNAPIEVLPFKQRSRATLRQLVQLVTSEVRQARAGGARRHSADLMQDWTDRTNEMLDSGTGKFRLWIRRHPWFTLLWLASLVPVAYLITRSRF